MPAAALVDGALLTAGGVDLIDGGLLELAGVTAEDLDRALVDGEDELAVRHPGGGCGRRRGQAGSARGSGGERHRRPGRSRPCRARSRSARHRRLRFLPGSVRRRSAAVRGEVWVIIDEVVRRVGELLVQVAVGSGGKQRAVVVRGIGVAPEHDPAAGIATAVLLAAVGVDATVAAVAVLRPWSPQPASRTAKPAVIRIAAVCLPIVALVPEMDFPPRERAYPGHGAESLPQLRVGPAAMMRVAAACLQARGSDDHLAARDRRSGSLAPEPAAAPEPVAQIRRLWASCREAADPRRGRALSDPGAIAQAR